MLLIAVLVFTCTLWIAGLLLTRFMTPRFATAERLSGLVRPMRRPAGGPGARWSEIPSIERAMEQWRPAHGLERLLDAADVPIKGFEFLLIAAVCALLAYFIVLVGTRSDLVAVAAAAIGGGVPLLWLLGKRNRRREAFNRQLPDALEALAGALRVGLSLNQGMAMVASDHPYPISAEFARGQRETNLGLSTEASLQNMAARVSSDEFDLAVAGMLTNRQVGGNMAELLDQVTATLRERVKLKNFIRVITAQQRLSAVIIMLVPPLLLVIMLLGLHEYSGYLLTTQAGHVMLAISLCMQLLGIYCLRRIGAIEV
jgi:tight adherence protein B